MVEIKADSAKGGSHAGERLDKLLALVTELPRLLHAVLGVAVLLGLLGASLLLQLTNLLGLKVAVLLLGREGEDMEIFLRLLGRKM